jgi:hypothetical protein
MLAPDLLTVTANGLQVIDNKTIDRRYVVLPIGAMRRPGAPSRKPAANRLAPTWYGHAARIVTSVQKRSIVCISVTRIGFAAGKRSRVGRPGCALSASQSKDRAEPGIGDLGIFDAEAMRGKAGRFAAEIGGQS